MPRTGRTGTELPELTERQQQVIRLMAAGRTNWEIAQELGLSLEGAKYHVSEILARFDVASREEAVAAWKEARRPSVRARRWAGGLAAGLGRLSFEAKAALGAGLAAIVVAAGVGMFLAGTGESTPNLEGPIETPEELLEQMDAVLGQDDKMLHLRMETMTQDDGVEATVDVEAWFDFAEDVARIEYATQWENEASPVRRAELLDGTYLYEIPTVPASPARSLASERRPACLDIEPYLAAIVACGVIDGIGIENPEQVKVVEDLVWEGQPALGLEYRTVREVSSRPRPPGTPSPTATMDTQIVVYTLYVERETMLPLALELVATQNGDPLGEFVLDFESELVDRDSIDEALFDPREQGYRTQHERELEVLDNPRWLGELRWLGRDVAADGDVPTLQLRDASDADGWYNMTRPALIRLFYGAPDGGVLAVELWESGGWEHFVEELGEGFLGSATCVERTEHQVHGEAVTIIAGYLMVETSDGGTPEPAGGPCRGHNRFMGVVEHGNYVTTINAPVGLYSDGPAWANSPEVLLALAGELRVRQQGE